MPRSRSSSLVLPAIAAYCSLQSISFRLAGSSFSSKILIPSYMFSNIVLKRASESMSFCSVFFRSVTSCIIEYNKVSLSNTIAPAYTSTSRIEPSLSLCRKLWYLLFLFFVSCICLYTSSLDNVLIWVMFICLISSNVHP